MSLVKILALTIRPDIKSFAIPSATHVRKSGLYYGNNVDCVVGHLKLNIIDPITTGQLTISYGLIHAVCNNKKKPYSKTEKNHSEVPRYFIVL